MKVRMRVGAYRGEVREFKIPTAKMLLARGDAVLPDQSIEDVPEKDVPKDEPEKETADEGKEPKKHEKSDKKK
jgi:hypothetical protein